MWFKIRSLEQNSHALIEYAFIESWALRPQENEFLLNFCTFAIFAEKMRKWFVIYFKVFRWRMKSPFSLKIPSFFVREQDKPPAIEQLSYQERKIYRTTRPSFGKKLSEKKSSPSLLHYALVIL